MIVHADCREHMATMDAASVDAIVTDPPYGLSFMGKGWDKGVPGVEFWQAAYRVLKPGAYLLAFGGTRTFHRMAVAIEDAGFEIRDSICWMFGSGFPKSLSVAKASQSAVQLRYGTAQCLCMDTGKGSTPGDHPRHGVCPPLRGVGQRADQATQEVGDSIVSVNESADSDAVRNVRSGDSAQAEGHGSVASALLLEGMRERGTEEAGQRYAALRSRMEEPASEGSTPRSSLSGMWEDTGTERQGTSCASPDAVSVRGDEQPDEFGGALRQLPPSDRGDDESGTGLDPDRRYARQVILDDLGGKQRPVVRVCSWCGLPDPDWIASLTPLGTALKPAFEPIIVARKPLAGTVAANVLEWGTGAINIDGCRIDLNGETWAGPKTVSDYDDAVYGLGMFKQYRKPHNPSGRWPANVVLDDEAAALLDEQSGERVGAHSVGKLAKQYQYPTRGQVPSDQPFTHGDTGGASRFFLNVSQDENPHDSGDFMVQCDCNCEATEGGEWVSQDHQASTRAASDTPPQRDTTGSLSGTANEGVLSWLTSSNGSATTVPSLMDSKSTTETATSRITESKTCNCSIQSPTSGFTQDANFETVSGGSRAHSAVSSSLSTPITGTSAVRVGRCTDAADHAISAESLQINSGDELRFRYTAKASRAERSAGLDIPSNHPTVKPISLMRWLVRLVTPPHGLILDPFAGSGTTGCAAALEGFQFIGIEAEADYVAIAERRIDHWAHQTRQPELMLAEVAD